MIDISGLRDLEENCFGESLKIAIRGDHESTFIKAESCQK